ncbi:hypothetical protein D3C72_2583580 [compost metagenome]
MQALIVVITGRTGGEKRQALLFGVDEMAMQHGRIGKFEIMAGIFLLGLQEDIAI